MDKSNVAIVIPALNESKTIAMIIAGVKPYGSVIVVDDGSSDSTKEVSEAAGALVVSHSRNKGYDAALLTGFNEAMEIGKKVVVSIDADGQHNPNDVLKILEPILSGKYNISLAYRQKPARLAEALFVFIAKYKYGIEDVLCGLKAFHIDVFSEYKEIMKKQTIGTGLAIHTVRAGYKPFQMPIIAEDREDTPRIGKAIKANLVIFKGMILALI